MGENEVALGTINRGALLKLNNRFKEPYPVYYLKIERRDTNFTKKMKIKHLKGLSDKDVRKMNFKWKEHYDFYKRALMHLIKYNLKIRDWMTWGTYGKTPDISTKLKLVLLKNMSDEHIEAILKTQYHIKGHPYEREFKRELRRRKRNPKLSIKETF